MKEQTELLNFFINPAFLEHIKQPAKSMIFTPYLSISLKFKRNGEIYDMTMYGSETGQVSIYSTDSMGVINTLIVQDHCKNIKELENLMKTLDDLSTRLPRFTKK